MTPPFNLSDDAQVWVVANWLTCNSGGTHGRFLLLPLGSLRSFPLLKKSKIIILANLHVFMTTWRKELHCNENPIYVFLFWELRGLSVDTCCKCYHVFDIVGMCCPLVTYLPQCSGSMTFLCGSGSADPCLWIMDPDSDPDPDPAIFFIDLRDANKKLI